MQGDEFAWTREAQFTRFWDHYEASERWRKSHATSARKAMSVAFPEALGRGEGIPGPSTSARTRQSPRKSARRGFSGHRQSTSRWSEPFPQNEDVDVKFEAEPAYDDIEMHNDMDFQEGSSADLQEEEPLMLDEVEEKVVEMTDEMKAFFEKTLAHRQQRDKRRADEQKEKRETREWLLPEDDNYVSAEKIGVRGIQKRPTQAVDENAALQRRREEARRLFGDGAERILAIEALLEMRFEQEYQRHRPPMWPNIPLRF